MAWQIKMDEESNPPTVFTIGPLDFYKCNRMPFGLTNAHASFQQLMGELPWGPQPQLVYHLLR